jgi:COMPASS component SWD3
VWRFCRAIEARGALNSHKRWFPARTVSATKDHSTLIEKPYRNQIFTMEYNTDGSKFATAGKDYKVRLYDEATKSPLMALSRGMGKMDHGHSNRVFSVKFHPTDEHLILSAGWDNTVQVWDLRVAGSVRSIFGPHICGDSMDIDPDGTEILTGSWRPENQIQTWDLASGALIDTINWPASGVTTTEPLMCYAARYSPDGKYIAAGGSGANELRLFDRKTSDSISTTGALASGVYSIDFASSCDRLICSLADGNIHTFDVPV